MDAKNPYQVQTGSSGGLDVVVGSDGRACESSPSGERGGAAAVGATTRRWIGIHFECCGVYTRLYRKADANRYEGKCPHCHAPVRVRVSPDGVSTSFIRARVV